MYHQIQCLPTPLLCFKLPLGGILVEDTAQNAAAMTGLVQDAPEGETFADTAQNAAAMTGLVKT